MNHIFKLLLGSVQCHGDEEKKICCPSKPPPIVPMDRCTAAQNQRPTPPDCPQFLPPPDKPRCANCDDDSDCPDDEDACPICPQMEKLKYCGEEDSCLPCAPLPKPGSKCPEKRNPCNKESIFSKTETKENENENNNGCKQKKWWFF